MNKKGFFSIIITLVLVWFLLSQIHVGAIVTTLKDLPPHLVMLGFVFYANDLVEVHRDQELGVGFGFFEATFEQVHGFDDVHVGEDFSQAVNQRHFFGVQEQFFASCARGGDVDGGVNATLHKTAIKV